MASNGINDAISQADTESVDSSEDFTSESSGTSDTESYFFEDSSSERSGETEVTHIEVNSDDSDDDVLVEVILYDCDIEMICCCNNCIKTVALDW